MLDMSKGKIIPNGVSLEKHESDTVVFFTDLNYDIELIPPSYIPNTKTPDFKMNGLLWEMKSPIGKTRSTIEHAFQAAIKQSKNIVFDLRRVQMPNEKAIKILEQLFHYSKNAKHLLIITKDKKILEYKKQMWYNNSIEGDLLPYVQQAKPSFSLGPDFLVFDAIWQVVFVKMEAGFPFLALAKA